ncbi:MAG: hypothetical protein RIM84_09770 [Alphaproteobacteria bacterium]
MPHPSEDDRLAPCQVVAGGADQQSEFAGGRGGGHSIDRAV